MMQWVKTVAVPAWEPEFGPPETNIKAGNLVEASITPSLLQGYVRQTQENPQSFCSSYRNS